MENLKVEYWKNGRYAIFDENNKIVDDAQGYGYKDKQKAIKAMWWKFNGGREKKNKEKSQFKDWMKDPINKKIYNEINNSILSFAKEMMRGETEFSDVIKMVENEHNMKIPKFVINNL
ncbi:MAG: hypothetical protein ACOC33_04050 [bacterium]